MCIYNDTLEGCLVEVGYISKTLSEIIIVLLYANDIIIFARCLFDLDKQLLIFMILFSRMDMIVNTNKTKNMVINSNKITYVHLLYDNRNLEEVSSYKYLGIDINHNINLNYNIENYQWRVEISFWS